MFIPFCAKPESILCIDNYIAEFSKTSESDNYIWVIDDKFRNRLLRSSYPI